jgi:hypothetical protein
MNDDFSQGGGAGAGAGDTGGSTLGSGAAQWAREQDPSYDMVPQAADAYGWTPPQDFELDAERHTALRTEAHKLGLTQRQFDGLMRQAVDFEESFYARGRAKAETELRREWGADMERRVLLAYSTYRQLGGDDASADAIGNHPQVIRLLARAGELLAQRGAGTGTGAPASAGPSPADASAARAELEELMRGAPGQDESPYWNPGDPRHKRVKARVAELHAVLHPDRCDLAARSFIR